MRSGDVSYYQTVVELLTKTALHDCLKQLKKGGFFYVKRENTLALPELTHYEPVFILVVERHANDPN